MNSPGRHWLRVWRRSSIDAGRASPAQAEQLRCTWDYPAPGSAIRGRTLVIDGWITGPGAETEIVVTRGGRVLGSTAARHPRPDVKPGLPQAVGFHLEVAIEGVAADRLVTVGLGLRTGPSEATVPLAERTFRMVDAGPLPYEQAFRDAETRGRPLHREHVYGSGPPAEEACEEMLAILRHHLGRRVLDLGCGAGPYGRALQATGRTVHGAEYAGVPARIARERGLSVVRADGRRLPFRDRTFDSVAAIEILEHIESPEAAVAECARVARENLVVSVPNAAVIPQTFPWAVVPWHLLEATHVNFFSAGTLEALLRQRFPHVLVGYYLRAFRFPAAPPLYAHVFAVASREAPRGA